MLEQARGSMSRHSKELRLEAGRWRGLIRGFHQGDQRFDYFSSETEFSNPRGGDSLIPTLLGTHLKNDLPTTYQKCRQWQVEVRNYWEAVQGLWLRWLGDVASRVKKEELLFEGANEPTLEEAHFDWHQINFALTLWREILWDNHTGRPDFTYQLDILGAPMYGVKEIADYYFASYLDKDIASGTKGWVDRAKDLHKQIYEEQKDLLLEEFQSLGLFEQQGRLKNMAADASRSLDIICRGGVNFEPGNCQFCAQILF